MVELIATIVIMGLILVPLSSAVIQALQTGPTARALTQTATDTDRLTSAMDDDIQPAGQLQVSPVVDASGTVVSGSGLFLAVNVSPSLPPPTWAFATLNPARQTPCVTNPAVGGTTTQLFYTASWDQSKGYLWHGAAPTGAEFWYWHYYSLVFTPYGTDVSGNAIMKVDVHRSDASYDWAGFPAGPLPSTPVDDGVYLTGYCKAGDTMAYVEHDGRGRSCRDDSRRARYPDHVDGTSTGTDHARLRGADSSAVAHRRAVLTRRCRGQIPSTRPAGAADLGSTLA